ncbi:molybdopterin-binding protein [Streptomyces lydicus]|uniref:molybdopterin-binding protein n=1 Tax=Streptomyces lydicus TaxID=47763 RepID=UPI002E332EE9|nr:molybdopterin-binding protein [Streptomyces lydicus]
MPPTTGATALASTPRTPQPLPAVSWAQARVLAHGVPRASAARRVPLADAAGLTLAEDLRSRRPLPAFDTAAMVLTEAVHQMRHAEVSDAVADDAGDVVPDIVVVTGSTSVGATDQLRGLLADAGARMVVDTVACRPGRPMLLAELPTGRWLGGLPGNPYAALVAAPPRPADRRAVRPRPRSAAACPRAGHSAARPWTDAAGARRLGRRRSPDRRRAPFGLPPRSRRRRRARRAHARTAGRQPGAAHGIARTRTRAPSYVGWLRR